MTGEVDPWPRICAEMWADKLHKSAQIGPKLRLRHGQKAAEKSAKVPNRFEHFLSTGKKKAPSVSAKCLILLPNLVGANGLEPSTPTMSRWCSNQLSYAPKSP